MCPRFEKVRACTRLWQFENNSISPSSDKKCNPSCLTDLSDFSVLGIYSSIMSFASLVFIGTLLFIGFSQLSGIIASLWELLNLFFLSVANKVNFY